MKNQRSHRPPFLANWLLARLLGNDVREELEGDLFEIYHERVLKRDRWYASMMYWVDVIHLCIGFFRKSRRSANSNSMWQHYMMIAFRSLSKNKTYATINILSLAVAMGVCIAIAQYVYSEFHQDLDLTQNPNVYRLTLERSKDQSLVDRDLYVAHSLGTIANAQLPEVTRFTRLYVPDEGAYVSDSGRRPVSIEAGDMYFVDTNFLNFFELLLLAGDPQNALDDLFNVVISDRIARRYFGSTNPIGKILTIGGGASHGDYKVTGVFADRPDNSHLRFDFLFPLDNFKAYGWMGAIERNPHLPWFVTYFELNPQADRSRVEQQLDDIIANHKAEWNPELLLTERTQLQPLSDIHLDANVYANTDYVTNKGNRADLNSYILVGTFILIIAWFNYINLSTAQSMRRAKEVGIRKSMGAKKQQLISQFLCEAVLINVISAILALGIGFGALDMLATTIDKSISTTLFSNLYFWLSFFGIVLIGAMLSGAYPAFLLSNHKSMNMLSTRNSGSPSRYNLRRALVTFQFLISLLLISGTYLTYKQIAYMQNEDLGIDMDQVLVVRGPKHVEVLDGGPQLTSYEGLEEFKKYSRKTFSTFRNEMLKIPAINSIAGSWSLPGEVYHTLQDDIRRWGTPESENQSVRIAQVGLDFFRTYDLELIAGSAFTADLSGTRSVVLNEKAVSTFGFASPQEAVGDRLYFGRPLEIVGVVKDYHWQSLKEDHASWIIWFSTSTPQYFSMKLSSINLQETLPQIQKVYDELYPGNPFEYFFIDDQFNQQYQADLQFGQLFFILTIIAIAIACIGLFALISYSATMKVKEFGVRKVLGATVSQLMLLLSKEYFILLALATVIAAPLITYLGTQWLNNYAFRIDLGVDVFVLPGLILVLVSIATVSHRTLTAARINPVDSLRSE